jgi:hypothetical protein
MEELEEEESPSEASPSNNGFLSMAASAARRERLRGGRGRG